MLASKRAQAEYRAAHPLPPPSAAQQRVAANDARRHGQYDDDEARLHAATTAFDIDDMRKQNRETREDLREGRIDGPGSLRHADLDWDGL